ncbi:ORCO protein, partial [Pseudoatta argentina]
MIQKQGHWVPYELKPRDVERRFGTCELLIQRQRRKDFLGTLSTSIDAFESSLQRKTAAIRVIVYVLDQLEELIRFTFIIMGALLQLMIVCYSGQKLMDESQNIFHRAYAAEWYKFSPRLKSLLIIILYRSIVSCKLTAGNLFSLSMAVFVSVVRTGVSYFTTLLSFKN